jgi:hypothetical protein
VTGGFLLPLPAAFGAVSPLLDAQSGDLVGLYVAGGERHVLLNRRRGDPEIVVEHERAAANV